MKIAERHLFLLSTIGVMDSEQVSYDNVKFLFYFALFAFPVLAFLEILLYVLYQYKVNLNLKDDINVSDVNLFIFLVSPLGSNNI